MSPRQQALARLDSRARFDIVVVGGGATGLGVAVDAAARGFSVALVESHDFAKGTSSRATKLVHGGVRYLAQGNIALVREALRERATLLRNAPHLARPLPFVMPSYAPWQTPFYGLGLKVYDVLAGSEGLGATRWLGRDRTLECLPTVRRQGLRGGVLYWDAQFDDARLAIALARTAERHGALVLNYMAVRALRHADGRVVGVTCVDEETGDQRELHAGCVVNATGVWVDRLRELDAQAAGQVAEPMVAASQGVHLVVDREFLPSDHALLIPKTEDGRVLFAVPWLGKVILGTTDTPRADAPREPLPFADEVDFILRESARYLERAPGRADVRSVWVGLRPLVKPERGEGAATRSISREHTVQSSPSGLVTVTGGKWTTYRAMAEDVLEACFAGGALPRRPAGVTRELPLVGAPALTVAAGSMPLHRERGLEGYGTDAVSVRALPGAHRDIVPGLSEAMIRFAARREYARRLEDVLARRSRLLFLDARRAIEVAHRVGAILGDETGIDPQIDRFIETATQYCLPP